MADPSTEQLINLWKRQIEEGTQAWLKLFGQGQAVDPQAFWRPFVDQGIAAWSKVMTQGSPSPDLLAQWKRFLDDWIAAWSKVLEQAMGTDAFAQALGKQLETFLSAGGPGKRAAELSTEASLAALGIPSRAQVIGLAQQIVQLEEKVEGLEDRLDAVLRHLGDVAAALKRERP
jgi:hypothetical protein